MAFLSATVGLASGIMMFYFCASTMPDSTIFVAVAVPTPLRTLFHYSLPSNERVAIGSRVRVPFGPRKLVGIVTEINSQPDIEVAKVRPVLEVFGAGETSLNPSLSYAAGRLIIITTPSVKSWRVHSPRYSEKAQTLRNPAGC